MTAQKGQVQSEGMNHTYSTHQRTENRLVAIAVAIVATMILLALGSAALGAVGAIEKTIPVEARP